MFITGDVKLWLQTVCARTREDKVDTWEDLAKELQAQFLPMNTAWIVRDALHKLKQNESVHEYVKHFHSLMLEINNMAEEDCLYNFLSGLQA